MSAASSRMATNGTLVQASEMMITGIARSGLPSQTGVGSPSEPRIQLIQPASLLNIARNMSATTTAAVMIGTR
jgi:hypothetical protein